jgi:hypothetical protein
VWALDWAIGNSVIGAPILMYFSDIACLSPPALTEGRGEGALTGQKGLKNKNKKTLTERKALMTFKTELPASVIKTVIKLLTDNDDDLLG